MQPVTGPARIRFRRSGTDSEGRDDDDDDNYDDDDDGDVAEAGSNNATPRRIIS